MVQAACADPQAPAPGSRAWLLLGAAIVGEVVGVVGLRFSEGFTVPLVTAGALGAFAFALFLVSRVMRVLPVSVAYPLWAGGGTAGVAALGMIALGEPVTPWRLSAVLLVILGVVLINRSGEKRSGC